MKEIERNDVVEMAARMQCAVCKAHYGRHGVQLLGRRGSAWLIALSCPRCEAEGLMIATVEQTEEGVVSVDQEIEPRPKVMYDVTYEEWLAFQQMPPISKDEVLDIHLFLRDFEGDFVQLLGGETNTEDNVK